jgi:predicted TIM-barrel fold metal-dependent hydrolase
MLGLRFTFHLPEQKVWLEDGTADWLWAAAEREGLPVMVFPPGSLAAIDAIAARHPGLRLVIDHLALWGAQKDEGVYEDLPRLVAMARHPNIAVKASALPCYSTQPYPFRGLHPLIRAVYDAYGPRRMFWGTDLTRLTCPYRQAVTLFTEELPWLPAADLEWIMGRGVCEWLGWPLSS